MAKAITEVAIGAAAIAGSFFIPGAGIALLGLSHAAAVGMLASIGATEVFAGIADALKPHQGGLAVAVTTPIGPWGYVYGTQKVGGVEIFRESNNNTGVSGSTSNNKQLHRVYVLACHPCELGSWQLRIDGKQVILEQVGSDWVSFSPTQVVKNITSIVRASGVVTMTLDGPISDADGTTLQVRSVADNTFNGTWTVTQPNPSDATTFTFVCGGADGSSSGGNARTTYSDYKDKIRVSFLNGAHTSTFPTLLAAGTTWGATDLCLGRTLVYVQMGYDDTVFPSSIPNVSFVIQGKNDILDPRTGTRGYTNNAALCIADFLSIPTKKGGFGLTIGTDIPTAQLIAAANLCDEAVALNAGGTIARYACDTFFQLNMTRGMILKNLLSSCAGRISYQGGQYFIFPGGWVSPTLQLGEADLVGPVHWKPRFSIRDTCNAVKGTYVSPENAYQQADVPAYMQDADHGYVSDLWLAEDDGERIFREANFPCTDNSATAQRLAKIALLRQRYQGRGTLRFNLKAYQAVALDVIQMTFPRYTWLNKDLEVLNSRIGLDKSGNTVRPYVELDVAETDSAIYDWSPTEQLTPEGYKQPNNVGVRVCMPPEDVTAYSGPGAVISGINYPSTITTGADGRVQNSIYVRWTQPNDANVVFGGHIEIQWQPVGASSWTALTRVDPSASDYFINGVSDGAQYNIQVRAVNAAGYPSDWIFVGPVTVGDALGTISYSGVAVAPAGTLLAQGFSDGTAQITVLAFTATVGGLTASCTPSPNILTGLSQAQLYYVYYVDANFQGGTITPVATQNTADFENKSGYFLIGSIITPSYSPRYQPTTFSDTGSDTTVNPSYAYDNDVTTLAAVPGTWNSYVSGFDAFHNPIYSTVAASGRCTWSGFSGSAASALTLHVLALFDASSLGDGTVTASITGKIGGTSTTLATFTASAALTDYTMTVPSGTDLSTVSVEIETDVTAGTAPGGGAAILKCYEIYIQ